MPSFNPLHSHFSHLACFPCSPQVSNRPRSQCFEPGLLGNRAFLVHNNATWNIFCLVRAWGTIFCPRSQEPQIHPSNIFLCLFTLYRANALVCGVGTPHFISTAIILATLSTPHQNWLRCSFFSGSFHEMGILSSVGSMRSNYKCYYPSPLRRQIFSSPTPSEMSTFPPPTPQGNGHAGDNGNAMNGSGAQMEGNFQTPPVVPQGNDSAKTLW